MCHNEDGAGVVVIRPRPLDRRVGDGTPYPTHYLLHHHHDGVVNVVGLQRQRKSVDAHHRRRERAGAGVVVVADVGDHVVELDGGVVAHV